MTLFWLSLAAAIVVVVIATTMAVLRGIELFRAFRSLGRETGPALAAIERSTGDIEGHLTAAARSGEALDASLRRLRRSRAELNVLLSALADARAAAGRLTAFWPAK